MMSLWAKYLLAHGTNGISDGNKLYQLSKTNFLDFALKRYWQILIQACKQIKEMIALDYNYNRKLTSFEELHQRNPNYYRSGKTKKEKLSYDPVQIALLQQLHGVTITQLGYEQINS